MTPAGVEIIGALTESYDAPRGSRGGHKGINGPNGEVESGTLRAGERGQPGRTPSRDGRLSHREDGPVDRPAVPDPARIDTPPVSAAERTSSRRIPPRSPVARPELANAPSTAPDGCRSRPSLTRGDRTAISRQRRASHAARRAACKHPPRPGPVESWPPAARSAASSMHPNTRRLAEHPCRPEKTCLKSGQNSPQPIPNRAFFAFL